MGNGCCCEETGATEPMAEITAVSPYNDVPKVSLEPQLEDASSRALQMEVVEDVKKTIVENGDKLMKPVLEVVYVTPDGQEKRVCFEQKPLGMEFRTGGYPITIQRVKGIAQEAGVECGWIIKSVGGQDVNTPDGSFESTMVIWKKCLEKLPRVSTP
mmetsp:Transcript_55123/g.129046  ORF Transcript_55123/g.129046 Transcript_55123/m.129046 type:complete len:157 (-) Transcript_55123:117-587(-)